jgi:phage-related protein
MPAIGTRCHELRIVDRDRSWRIMYRIEADAVLILAVFAKKTAATPSDVIRSCRSRLRRYERAVGGQS